MWPKYNLIGVGDLLAQMAKFSAAPCRPAGVERARRSQRTHSCVPRAAQGCPQFAAARLRLRLRSPPNILASLGMVDDMGDGTISVELRGLRATSRVVVAPPSFAPDRRLPVSLADGLADRVDRDRVRSPKWITDDRASADAEVADLLDRAYETAGLQNVDAVADFFRQENRNRPLRPDNPFTPQQAADLLWDRDKVTSVQPLPLTVLALQRHRRNTARLFFEIFSRRDQGLVRAMDASARRPAEILLTSACPGSCAVSIVIRFISRADSTNSSRHGRSGDLHEQHPRR